MENGMGILRVANRFYLRQGIGYLHGISLLIIP
jgi:hypothetical protein